MKRRSFVIASGSGLLAGSGSIFSRSAFALDFQLESVPDRQPKNVSSVLVDFTKFELVPRYVDDSENVDISISITTEGGDSTTVNEEISISGKQKITRSDLDSVPVILDVESTNEAIKGEVVVEVQHSSIGRDNYREQFVISDNPLINKLVSYYPMAKGAGGILNNGASSNNGVMDNATWINNSKVGDYSLSFDGAKSFVDIGTTLSSPDSWTVAAWVKPKDPSVSDRPNEQEIVSFGDDGDTPRTMVVCRDTDGESSDVKFTIFADDGTNEDVSPGTTESFDIQNWYHVAFVRSNDNWKVYVNGDEKASLTASVNDTINSQRINIGRALTDDAHFHGLIDDVRIYNRALSSSEITSLSDLESPSGDRITDSDVPNTGSGGIAKYSFNGDLTDDWSSNDGTGSGVEITNDSVYGSSVSFDKSNNDYVEVSNPDSSLDITGDITVAVWAKWDSKSNHLIVGKDSYNNNQTYEFSRDGPNNSYVIRYRIDGTLYRGGFTPQNNKWYHLAWVLKDGDSILYVDGQREEKLNTETISGVNDSSLQIGGEPGGSVSMDGNLDDLRIYRKALEDSEIKEIYSKGSYNT